MFLTKKSPGSVGEHVFDGAPVQVPDDLAGELLAIAPDEFEQADAPAELPKRGAFPAADKKPDTTDDQD